MTQSTQKKHFIYEGEGDSLMSGDAKDNVDHIVLIPDARPSKTPDRTTRLRIMWGQHLLEDLLIGRYRSLVCAVNPDDNSRGIIAQLATLLPTSQWDPDSITAYARQFAQSGDTVKVLKYDMDAVEVLALLRPAKAEHLTLDDISTGFKLVAEMIRTRTQRLPAAAVSFLGARSNALLNPDGNEPSFEAVLRTMYEAGFTGDVFPAPKMWACAPVGVYARYPFPPSLERMREGGF